MKRAMFAVFAAALIGVGCKSSADHPVATKTSEGQTAESAAAAPKAALVRFVNAEPTIDRADLFFGQLPVFSGIEYKSVTSYQDLPGDKEDFRLRGTGMPSEAAVNREGLKAGRRYTVVAMRKADNSSTLAVFEEAGDASASAAKVRLINAAASAGDLALALRGEKDFLASGVKFGQGTGYRDVKPGTAVLEIRGKEKKMGGVRAQNRTLEAGKLYTLIALGDGDQSVLYIQDEVLPKTAMAR